MSDHRPITDTVNVQNAGELNSRAQNFIEGSVLSQSTLANSIPMQNLPSENQGNYKIIAKQQKRSVIALYLCQNKRKHFSVFMNVVSSCITQYLSDGIMFLSAIFMYLDHAHITHIL